MSKYIQTIILKRYLAHSWETTHLLFVLAEACFGDGRSSSATIASCGWNYRR